MAIGNFLPSLKVTLGYEGGWSDHPADPGGATMKGITIGRYRQYHPDATKTDLRNISDTEVEMIYRADYWKPVRGDELPYGVDLATFDFGVNSGPARAARYLQAVVGVTQDGKVGPKTIAAVVESDGKKVIQSLCAKRLSFVQGLKTFATFGRGWSRRIADVEAKAVAMWLTTGMAMTPTIQRELKAEADKAADVADAQSRGGDGAVAGGGAAVATDVAVNDGGNWAIMIAVIIVVAFAAALLKFKARRNRDRAEAYLSEADG